MRTESAFVNVQEGELHNTPITAAAARLLPPPFDVDVDSLPSPTEDIDVLQAQLARYGYCLVANAMDRELLARVQHRLAEQAAAEREAGLAVRDGGVLKRLARPDATAIQPNQKVLLLANKGDAFRELIMLPKPSAIMDQVKTETTMCLAAPEPNSC